MSDKLKTILFDLFNEHDNKNDVIKSLLINEGISKEDYAKIINNYDNWYNEYNQRNEIFYILRELDKFDLINPTNSNIKKYYTMTTGIDSKDSVQEEINQIQDRLFDYERYGRGSEKQYNKDLKKLEELQNTDALMFDTMTIEQKKEYLTEHIMNEMLDCGEISQKNCDDFYNNYNMYIEKYIQYKQGEDILKDYTVVDLLSEFKELQNIDKINNFFEKNNWKLLKTKDDYYQLYFGKNIQVDNMYEYGFSHLLDNKSTKNALESFINYRIELENNLDKDNNYNFLEMYKNMPDYYKNNLEKLYILDGIYTVSPNINRDDVELIYSVCEKNQNENINPFSISHYLTDHYTRGNITKNDLENARISDITTAVFYDDLSYLKQNSNEKDIDICD